MLSDQPRVLDGPQIALASRSNRRIFALVESEVTDGIFVTELQFPAPGVRFFSPQVGFLSFGVDVGGSLSWTAPVSITLSQQGVYLGVEGVDLDAVALIPSPGCRMDVTTSYS